MKIGAISSLLAATAMAASPAGALAQDKTQRFKPTGQWALDYGEDYCRLSRSFSDGKDDLALALERVEPGTFMRMILVSDAIKPFRSADEIGWHFTPADAERKARYTRSVTEDGKAFYNLGPVTIANPGAIVRLTSGDPGDIPPPPPYDRSKELAAAKSSTGFILASGLTEPVQVETENLEAPIGALQACADDLAKTWGLDPAKLRAQTSPVIPDDRGSGWLPQGTIEFADFAKLGGGANQLRLMVDASGKPTSCHVHWPTLSQATNDKICKILMSKANFTPAKDADGAAMAGYFVSSPIFLLPPFPGGRGR